MPKLSYRGLKPSLDALVKHFNQPNFIHSDPISIPHRYIKPLDQEVAGFIAAMFSWGQRQTIIQKSREFLQIMDNDPYLFIRSHSIKDRQAFKKFKHRTFQYPDAEFFLSALQEIYHENQSLEDFWFKDQNDPADPNFIYHGLVTMHNRFFYNLPTNFRSRKHLSSPEKKSTCKRTLMFLRWMVRKDNCGVDLGIWPRLPASSLLIPLDVHVFNSALRLGLCTRKSPDWSAVMEITQHLRHIDPLDPIKYDFALFSFDLTTSTV